MYFTEARRRLISKIQACIPGHVMAENSGFSLDRSQSSLKRQSSEHCHAFCSYAKVILDGMVETRE